MAKVKCSQCGGDVSDDLLRRYEEMPPHAKVLCEDCLKSEVESISKALTAIREAIDSVTESFRDNESIGYDPETVLSENSNAEEIFDMSDEIEVTVNHEKCTVPSDFGSTAQEFAEALGFDDQSKWRVYRVSSGNLTTKLTPEERCGEPFVVDDGEEFAVIPEYTIDG